MCTVSRSIAEYKCMHERQTGGKVNMEVAEVVKVDEFTWSQPLKGMDSAKGGDKGECRRGGLGGDQYQR